MIPHFSQFPYSLSLKTVQMKPVVLDVIIGIGSLIVFVLMLKVLPTVIEPSLGYLVSLLLFVLAVCTGGFLASVISSK